MANVLAHGLAALALHSALWSLLSGEPLSAYGFVAALAALLPDLELGRGGGATPYGHSLGYALLWSLLAVAGLSLLATASLLSAEDLVPLFLAVVVGLGTHVFLDALVPPGIWTVPCPGEGWAPPRALLGPRWSSAVNGGTSGLSLAGLVLLVVLG